MKMNGNINKEWAVHDSGFDVKSSERTGFLVCLRLLILIQLALYPSIPTPSTATTDADAGRMNRDTRETPSLAGV